MDMVTCLRYVSDKRSKTLNYYERIIIKAMNQFQYPDSGSNSQGLYYQDEALQRSLVQRVFLWMTMGLGITAVTSLLTYDSSIFYSIVSNNWYMGLLLAEVALVWIISRSISRLSFSVATALFALYSVLNGVTLSVIFAVYTLQSIAETFFVAAGTFGATALFGYVTKRDLSKWGSFLMMALIGLIIASVVNYFVGSSTFSLITSAVGVVLFTALTAYDVWRYKKVFAEVTEDSEEVKKISLLAALNLYLDFINLFLYLLRFLGRSRD